MQLNSSIQELATEPDVRLASLRGALCQEKVAAIKLAHDCNLNS